MSNKRNERVQNGEDVRKYLEKMIDNAEKHGVTIQTLTFKAYRIGHGGMLNPKMIEDDVEQIIEDSKDIHQQLIIRSILGCEDGED